MSYQRIGEEVPGSFPTLSQLAVQKHQVGAKNPYVAGHPRTPHSPEQSVVGHHPPSLRYRLRPGLPRTPNPDPATVSTGTAAISVNSLNSHRTAQHGIQWVESAKGGHHRPDFQFRNRLMEVNSQGTQD